MPWSRLLRQPLAGIEVDGPERFPQSFRLTFPALEVVVAVGHPLEVGDFDELLVFSGAGPDGRWNGQLPDWITLWKA